MKRVVEGGNPVVYPGVYRCYTFRYPGVYRCYTLRYPGGIHRLPATRVVYTVSLLPGWVCTPLSCIRVSMYTAFMHPGVYTPPCYPGVYTPPCYPGVWYLLLLYPGCGTSCCCTRVYGRDHEAHSAPLCMRERDHEAHSALRCMYPGVPWWLYTSLGM